jgi:hypothetical protein
MAIDEKKTVVYEAKCSECGKEFEDQGLEYIPVYLDKGQLIDALEAMDWVLSGAMCWCDECDPTRHRL